jgi:pyruvate formate lyase activating enzyme
MKIGGFQKTSLLDYPGNVSAIVWTVGCNFYCPFCYNKDIVEGKTGSISEKEIFEFLEKRKGLLDGLVITGGEPLLQKDIVGFCEKVKKLGYLVKVDTNGMFPDKLQVLIDKKLVDYIAMDIKASKKKYSELSGVKVDIKKIQKSIDLIKNSGVDYEFRTTFIPELLTSKDVVEIGKWLESSKRFFIQQFKNDVPMLSSKMTKIIPYSKDELLSALEKLKPFFEFCDVRGI